MVENLAPKVCCGTFVLLLLLLVILLPSSLEKVGSTEVALAYDNVWAHLNEEILREGLQTKPTFGSLIKWPTDYQLVEFTGTSYKDSGSSQIRCNSKDGIQITLKCSFQFVPDSEKIYDLTMKFRDFDNYKSLVEIQARSAIRHACGDYTAEQFQSARADVQNKTEVNVKRFALKNFDAIVKLLQLKNIARPARYQAAVEAAETAKADIKLAENQRDQELTKAKITKDKSIELARATLNTAYTQGNITLAFAQADATAVKERYKAYEDAYYAAKVKHKLSVPGILSYFGTQMISGKAGPNQVHNLPSMAKLDYKDEL
jgi:hypothetical protein